MQVTCMKPTECECCFLAPASLSFQLSQCKCDPELQAQQMLSVVCGGYSGPGSVAVCRIPVPRVTSNKQVLVRVMSAGLDRTDVMAVSGWARLERRKPHGGFTLGRDFCGIVVEAGVGVSHVHPGDRVWGLLPYHLSGSLSGNSLTVCPPF